MEPQKLDLHPLDSILGGSYASLNCPLPDCGHELSIKYIEYIALGGWNFNESKAPSAEHSDVSDWVVECLSGHVILTPGPIDTDDEDCVESDEVRIFTDRDMKRLIRVLKLMNVDWESVNV